MVSTTASTRWAPVGQRRACMARMPWISQGVPTTAMRGLGRQLVAGEVQLGQGHGLVVEAARGGLVISLGRGGDGGDALPRLVGIVAGLGDQRAVDLPGRPAAAMSSALTAPPSWTSSERGRRRARRTRSTTAPSPSAGGPPVIFQ